MNFSFFKGDIPCSSYTCNENIHEYAIAKITLEFRLQSSLGIELNIQYFVRLSHSEAFCVECCSKVSKKCIWRENSQKNFCEHFCDEKEIGFYIKLLRKSIKIIHAKFYHNLKRNYITYGIKVIC